MEYNHNEDGTFTKLLNKNVDTGMGVERVVAILEGVNDNYQTSIWKDIIKDRFRRFLFPICVRSLKRETKLS
jgi:alanyl-tRNA synthetase